VEGVREGCEGQPHGSIATTIDYCIPDTSKAGGGGGGGSSSTTTTTMMMGAFTTL